MGALVLRPEGQGEVQAWGPRDMLLAGDQGPRVRDR